MARRKPTQLDLELKPKKERTWGGAREGAGRKRKPGAVLHRARPEHKRSHPVHVDFKVARDLPSLRDHYPSRALQGALTRAADCVRKLEAANEPVPFRVVHYSIQPTHLHFLVEAADRRALMYGIRGLEVRLARAINSALGRRGRVIAGRYFARACRGPRETRACLAYVLLNFKKHTENARGVDELSSGIWFTGWKEKAAASDDPPAVATPATWLLGRGWEERGGGKLSTGESPRDPWGSAGWAKRRRVPRPHDRG